MRLYILEIKRKEGQTIVCGTVTIDTHCVAWVRWNRCTVEGEKGTLDVEKFDQRSYGSTSLSNARYPLFCNFPVFYF